MLLLGYISQGWQHYSSVEVVVVLLWCSGKAAPRGRWIIKKCGVQ